MGTVDVERYTGSCLISTALRPKAKLVQQQQQQRGVDVGGASAAGAGAYGHSDARNWAGVPLVSMAASIRKGGAGGGTGKGGGAGDWRGGGVRRYQGAPLIRAPAAPANKNGAKKMERRAPAAVVAVGSGLICAPVPCSGAPGGGVGGVCSESPESLDGGGGGDGVSSSAASSSSDCYSVTSDEGLASGGSESSLPRIIKARKRRRKDAAAARRRGSSSCGGGGTSTCSSESGDAGVMLAESLLQLNLNSNQSADQWVRRDIWTTAAAAPTTTWTGAPASAWINVVNDKCRSSCWPKLQQQDSTVAVAQSTPASAAVDLSKTPQLVVPPANCAGVFSSLEVSSEIITSPYGHLTAPLPPMRPWVPLGHPDRTRPTCIFTVMCYNVLCDKYATRQMYGYCPSWVLKWEYRRKGILEEIRHYSADIISLQEVETEQFYNYFLPELKRDGYDGIFSPKSRAKTMAESDRRYVDGCAIFYRTAKFSLIFEHLIEFNQLALAKAEGCDDMLNRVMTKDNIGLAALLETKEAAWSNGIRPDPSQIHQPLLVCTAHIHWDPQYCDVKLVQTMMLMNELKQITQDAGHSFRPGHKADPSHIQLLLCGDFNSLPDSGVVELLSQSRIMANHPDFKEFSYKSCLQKMSSFSEKSNEFTHPFRLSSAYTTDVMPYSNYTFDFKGLIDYIFYSKNTMVPLGLLGPVDAEWFRENKIHGCPHRDIPSDHFSLLVELEMTPTYSGLGSNGFIPRR
nr:EOG090X06K5 [Leptodora kindtii]